MIYIIFSVRLLSVLRGHSVLSSPPQRPIITEFEGFLYTIFYRLHLFSILILERKSHYFPFQCWVLNKVTIFITDLVWRGPWLGIEHGTARTQCQHSTTRLSRKRNCIIWIWIAVWNIIKRPSHVAVKPSTKQHY